MSGLPCQPRCESISEEQESSLPAGHLLSNPIQPRQANGIYSDPVLEELRLLNITHRAEMARMGGRPPMDEPPAAYPVQQKPIMLTAPFQTEGESLHGNWERDKLAEQPCQQPALPAPAIPLELPTSDTENPQQEPILNGYNFPSGGEEKNHPSLLPAPGPPPATGVPSLEQPLTAPLWQQTGTTSPL